MVDITFISWVSRPPPLRPTVAAALFLAGLTCGLAGLALIAARRIGRRTLLPFVPFLGLGVLAVLAGQALRLVWF